MGKTYAGGTFTFSAFTSTNDNIKSGLAKLSMILSLH
jgi:hypothetical protein